MKTVKQMIDEKSQELLFVPPDKTVFVALKLMDKFELLNLIKEIESLINLTRRSL